MVVMVVLNILTITSTVKSTSNMLTWRRQDARLSAGGRCPSTRPNPDPRDRERERRLDAKTILNVIVHHTVTNNIKFLTTYRDSTLQLPPPFLPTTVSHNARAL